MSTLLSAIITAYTRISQDDSRSKSVRIIAARHARRASRIV